jgi:metal-responsive CopG/Arc/MetJ family transcriptional regulator
MVAQRCYTGVTRGRGFMPTAKKRVNLTIEDELYDEFEALKKMRKDASISSIILDLAKEALEINEDLYYAKIAKARLGEKKFSHAEIWSKKRK